ncbi:MAG: hypothetical protein Q7R81_03765 [Candidatus Peregrinibacteria bacterium]|nr:hypothetical protein [Candidatus Peregrinibacteria bacterium]
MHIHHRPGHSGAFAIRHFVWFAQITRSLLLGPPAAPAEFYAATRRTAHQ